MSYSIEYNPELNRKYPKMNVKKHLPTKKPLYLLVFLIVSYVFVQVKIYRYFIPGNPDVTISAFSKMVDRVSEGNPVKDAVFAFCQEVIINSN